MTQNKKSDIPVLLIIFLVALGIYLVYKLVIFLSKFFVYVGFNLFFFTDNLLKFESANPIVLWGILGLFIGSIVGVTIAVKKYKLSKLLILYPIATVVVLITILSFVNKPTNVSGVFEPTTEAAADTTATITAPQLYYTVMQDVNVRARPSATSMKLFALPKGAKVIVIQNEYDSRNKIWSKIEYTNSKTGALETGYVNANFLRYMN